MAGVVRPVVRHVEMPYVEVIRRAHLVDGVVERMVGRHRSERAVQVTRMIRTVRAISTVGEVELGQRFTRVVIGVAGMLRVVVVLGVLRVVVVLGVLRVVVVLGMLRVVVVLGLLLVIVVLPFLATLVLVVAAVVGLGWLAFLAWDAEFLYRLENACNAAQDRHGFAPRSGLATVAGTCLVRITTPSPLLSPTHADGCSGEK